MKVAAVQFKARKGDLSGSLAALSRLTTAAAQDVDLVVLPEMAATGYVFPDVAAARGVAEAPDGPTFQALAPIASARGCWVVCGFPEVDRDRLFNSALVIDPAGQLSFVYRKTLLYEVDTSWASDGDSGYRRFDTAHGSFGVGICMDLNDDRFIAWCAGADLDAVALPTNWVEEGQDTWPYWAWRIGPLRGALIAANTWGDEGGIQFRGASAVIRKQRVLAAAPRRGDGWISTGLLDEHGIMRS